ncbi:hypothetical protein [Intrasporangium sp.]|uniref:hypothetical protein n=1 Tax=Intrasporangium sp. TaxID=1925024 RepID=UPI00336536EB
MTHASNSSAVHLGWSVPRGHVEPAHGPQAKDGGPLRAAYFGCLGGLVVVATVYGLVAEDAYRLVPALTRQTWRAQDAVTLLLVPVLLWSSRRARAGSLSGHLLTTGIALWLAYCYAHLSIGAPLNPLFLVYVAILGLAGFATLDGVVRLDVTATSPAFGRAPRRAATWLLTAGGIGTAALWLTEIIGAWPDGRPPNLHLSELPNPTWVLDLAWTIPMSLGAAALVLRRHAAGPVLAAVMLVFLLVLSASMVVVTPLAWAAGLQTDPGVRNQIIVFTVLFTILGAVEAWLLAMGQRRMGTVTASWLRAGWWPTAT